MEQQKNNNIWSINKQSRILLQFLHSTKQSNILSFLKRIIRTTQQEKEIRHHHGQRRISQNILRKKPHRRICSTRQRRAHSAILTRTKPNRNMLESNKKRSNTLTILHKNRRHARSTRNILEKTYFYTKLYRILMSLTK